VVSEGKQLRLFTKMHPKGAFLFGGCAVTPFYFDVPSNILETQINIIYLAIM
jgi:hypothetical protein